jgi:hypothetical protein
MVRYLVVLALVAGACRSVTLEGEYPGGRVTVKVVASEASCPRGAPRASTGAEGEIEPDPVPGPPDPLEQR